MKRFIAGYNEQPHIRMDRENHGLLYFSRCAALCGGVASCLVREQTGISRQFFSDDAFYLDPGVPVGVSGNAELLNHFRKLLAYNPNWAWSQIEAIPMEDGFLNKWRARIPLGDRQLDIVGVCLVQLNGERKIRRNEVYFDRSELLAEIAKNRAAARLRD